jgi:hypothetical protein
MTDDEIAKLKRVVEEKEMQVAAQIATLLALAESGFDTSEAEAALWQETNALTVLRHHQAAIIEMREP